MFFWLLLFRKTSTKNIEKMRQIVIDKEFNKERHRLLEYQDRKQYSEFMSIN